MTFDNLRNDKMRTLLSVIGISVGIFCIVAVFTVVSSMEYQIQKGFDLVLPSVIQVNKYPNFLEDEDGNETLNGSEYKWWDYVKRADIKYVDYKYLIENSKTAQTIAMSASFYSTIISKAQSLNDVEVRGITHNYTDICAIGVMCGRYFSLKESEYGAATAVIGDNVAAAFFKDAASAVGKTIKIKGRKLIVIGVFKQLGDTPIGRMFSIDDSVFIPFTLFKSYKNILNTSLTISIKPNPDINESEFKAEITSLLRSSRRIAPSSKNDFSINSVTFLQGMVDSVYSTLSLAGIIISSFSLLIGAFGIANIMFVSVNERTNIIGIQKALGAKRYFILLQFLFEAIWLAIIGAVMGIAILYVIIALIPASDTFTISLSPISALKGIGISFVIGVFAGVIPAWSGANLNPIDAINHT